MTLPGSRTYTRKLMFATVMVAAVVLLPQANAQDDDAAPKPASNVTLTGRKLVSSVFETNSAGTQIDCTTAGCTSPLTPLFPQASLPCPGASGTTCTFYILIESTNQISPSDAGLYKIFVDGKAATPGPVDSSGLYKFVESDPNSDDTHSNSAGIVATVTNTSTNQVHHTTIGFGCTDDSGDGCDAYAALSSLRVDIFQP